MRSGSRLTRLPTCSSPEGEVRGAERGLRAARSADIDERQAHAVDGDAALRHEKAPQRLGRAHADDVRARFAAHLGHLADPLDVAGHDVSAETGGSPDGALEVDARPHRPAGRGFGDGLFGEFDGEGAATQGDDRQAAARDRDRIA
jgi:hypothetical protein